MDADRFDRVTRWLTTMPSRRAILGVAVATLLGPRLAPLATDGRSKRTRHGRGTRPGGRRDHRGRDRDRQRNGQHRNDRKKTTPTRDGQIGPEECIPTGKQCPAPKRRTGKGHGKQKGKSSNRRIGCEKCCQGTFVTAANGQHQCACKQDGVACETAAHCCSGICASGVCTAPQPTDCGATCTGCCSAAGLCQPGTSAEACGLGGTTCRVCDGLAGTCVAGVCACDVCAEGCAFATVQAAVAAADAGATITLCPGTFTETITIDKDLTLLGAGAERTTLDGGGAGPVVTIAAGNTVTLRDLTITGGVATGDGGGGVFNQGTLTLTNCDISGNTADVEGDSFAGGGGGGIFNEGTATLIACDVAGNTVTGDGDGRDGGGGIRNLGTLTATDCTIRDNTTADTFNNAGGIHNDGTLTLTNCAVTGNSAFGNGGGLNNTEDGTMELTGCEFSGNSTTNPGGGMFNGGTAEIADCTISDNTSRVAGAGINNAGMMTLSDSDITENTTETPFTHGGGITNSGTAEITDCTIAGNTSSGLGGGIHNFFVNGSMQLSGCTIDENDAVGPGGGIYNEAPLTVIDCDITDNTAGEEGGGINNFQVTVTLDADCQITGNEASDGGGIYNENGTVNLNGAIVSANIPDNCDGTVMVPGCMN